MCLMARRYNYITFPYVWCVCVRVSEKERECVCMSVYYEPIELCVRNFVSLLLLKDKPSVFRKK